MHLSLEKKLRKPNGKKKGNNRTKRDIRCTFITKRAERKTVYAVPSSSFEELPVCVAGLDLLSRGDVCVDGGEVARLSRSPRLARALWVSLALDQSPNHLQKEGT